MCGIAGYITKDGKKPAATKKQLARMLVEASTRGRQATGIFWERDNQDMILKMPLEASELVEYVPWGDVLKSHVCLMHTRHATQGDPRNNVNNHPLASNDNKTIVVHNGVILNSHEYVINTITDSYSLIEAYYIHRQRRDTFAMGFKRGLKHLTGSMGVAVYNRDEKRLLLIKNENPVCIGFKKNTVFFASTMKIMGHVNPAAVFIMPERYMYSIKGNFLKGYPIKTKNEGGDFDGKSWRDFNSFGRLQ